MVASISDAIIPGQGHPSVARVFTRSRDRCLTTTHSERVRLNCNEHAAELNQHSYASLFCHKNTSKERWTKLITLGYSRESYKHLREICVIFVLVFTSGGIDLRTLKSKIGTSAVAGNSRTNFGISTFFFCFRACSPYGTSHTETNRQTAERTDGWTSRNAASRTKIARVPKRSPAVARIADCTDYQWPLRSSKVDDCHFIWKGVCDFLLVVNSNLGPISHCFWDTTTHSLKLSIENCAVALIRKSHKWNKNHLPKIDDFFYLKKCP